MAVMQGQKKPEVKLPALKISTNLMFGLSGFYKDIVSVVGYPI